MKLEKTEGRLETTTTALNKAEDNVAQATDKNIFLAQENVKLSVQLKQLQLVDVS